MGAAGFVNDDLQSVVYFSFLPQILLSLDTLCMSAHSTPSTNVLLPVANVAT